MGALHTARSVVRFEIGDLARSRWLVAYALFFVVAADALFRFGGTEPRSLLSLVNIVLLVVPLAAVAFGTMHFHNRREFVELLLAQPVGRRALFAGLYLGLTIPLMVAVAIGLVVPATLHGLWSAALGGTLAALLVTGLALTAIFTALAMLVAVCIDDRLRGLAVSLSIWLALSVLYDGLVLIVASVFADHALERPLLALMIANPIDLARIALLLQFDVAALMGYTGAVFAHAFGSSGGLALATTALVLWVLVPAALGARAFARRDL
jgi:Cu-processing system permease protein